MRKSISLALLLVLELILVAASFPPPTSKPPVGVRINRGHMLARGLRYAWLTNEAGGNRMYDIASQADATFAASGAAPTWSPRGNTWLNYTAASSQFVSTDSSSVMGYANWGSVNAFSFTVALWATPTSANASYKRIFDTAYSSGVFLGTNTTGAKWDLIVAGWGLESLIGGTPTVGVEAMVAGTVAITTTTTGTGILYENGVQVGTFTGTSAAPNSNKLYFGSQQGGGGSYFDGRIGPIYVWDRVLNPGEIQALYRNPYIFMMPHVPIWARMNRIFTSSGLISGPIVFE